MPTEVTIVSGLPRSGTSLMMQMLGAGGLSLLTDQRRVPDESNPRGYFEFEPVTKLRTDRSWLEQAQGQAVKIVHILLPELPTDGSFSYRVLLMKRPIDEVLASQRVMLEKQGKKSGEETTLSKIYRDQLARVEQWLGSQSCFKLLPIDYHRVLKDPKNVAQEIVNFLGRELNIQAMAAAVDPTLYRQRSSHAS